MQNRTLGNPLTWGDETDSKTIVLHHTSKRDTQRHCYSFNADRVIDEVEVVDEVDPRSTTQRHIRILRCKHIETSVRSNQRYVFITGVDRKSGTFYVVDGSRRENYVWLICGDCAKYSSEYVA
jgi:hypothetical protein